MLLQIFSCKPMVSRLETVSSSYIDLG